MGKYFNKKHSEIIKKVNVKLACVCGNQPCSCSCSTTESTKYDSSEKVHGRNSADFCGEMNRFITSLPVIDPQN